MNSEDFLPFSNSKNLLQKLFFVHSMHTEGPFGLVSFEFGGKPCKQYWGVHEMFSSRVSISITIQETTLSESKQT